MLTRRILPGILLVSLLKGPGHNGMLLEDGRYWIVYHAYDANQIGVPKLRIESLSWDADGWPSLPSQAQKP